MIELKHLTKSYKKTKALDDFSAQFNNKIYGLLGPNGSGKTTLFRIITGLIKADKGSVKHSGKRKLGYLPQRFGLIAELTLEKHMMYFAELKEIDKKKRNKEVQRVLELVGLDEKRKEKCSSLSGGMVRRAGIAQALLGSPEMILLDEATVGLDPEERLRFKLIISSLEEQCPIVLATHIVEDVDALCERVIVLKEGRILLHDSLKALTDHAKDKVFVLAYEDLSKLQVEHRIIRLYTEGPTQKKMVRILLQEQNALTGPHLQPVYPTTEDGYLAITT